AHVLGGAAADADLADTRAVHHALGRDDHDLMIGVNGNDADHLAVAFAGADIADTLAAAALLPVTHVRAITARLAAFGSLRAGLRTDLRRWVLPGLPSRR